MLDIQTKKKIFYDKSAHNAPIRDIAMCDTSSDVFASSSYDCNIKVFDLRSRSAVQKYQQEHPMSTLCISSCGTFLVAGNLKGDVISYDFRSMNEPLNTTRVHDSAVIRVAFVPSLDGAAANLGSSTINATKWETSTPLNGKLAESSLFASTRPSAGLDSFSKFVDVNHHRNRAVADELTPKHEDSWRNFGPGKRPQDFSTDSINDTALSGDYRTELRLKRHSRLSIDPSPMSKISEPMEIESETPKTSRSFAVDRQYRDLQQKLKTMNEIDGKAIPLCNITSVNSISAQKRRSTFHDSFSLHIKGKICFFMITKHYTMNRVCYWLFSVIFL